MQYQLVTMRLAVTILANTLLVACGSEEDTLNGQPPITPTTTVACDTHKPVFLSDVWPVLKARCLSCHELDTVTSDLNLVSESVTDFNEINFAEFKAIAVKKDDKNLSWMLTKPSNINGDHGGNEIFTTDSAEYKTFQDMVTRLDTCMDDIVNSAGVIQNTPYEQLRKSTLSLAGRLPTRIEEDSLVAAGNDSKAIQSTLDGIVDQVMNEDAFYTRLKEIFNDKLLLDAFPNNQLLNIFRLNNFANNEYFTSANIDAQNIYSTQERNLIRSNANRGVADAPLELIAHVVKNNRPFTEILTANYTLVNPYSATIFSVNFANDPTFNFVYGDAPNLHNPNDFREAVLTDKNGNTYPHAGILTTLTYLTRYPSTNTNRNRARSRVTYLYFLNTDVQGLADRAGLDLENVMGQFPTLQDPQCTACHDIVDPLAGLFKNWRNSGQFGLNNNWFSERNPAQMLPPGYTKNAVDLLPAANNDAALQWLASRIVNDGRFATSVVKIVFKGLTGQQVPQDTLFVESLKTNFINNGFEIRVLIKDILNSIYFSAKNLGSGETPANFQEVGMGRLLTPEQLHEKIRAVTGGYTWISPSLRDLRHRDTYNLLYGGIDSVTVTERTTNPTSLIIGIQERLALQTSCKSVPLDFNKPTAQRALFPLVEITDTPDTSEGQIRIKQNIKHLYKQILGEELSISHAEVNRAYQLFTDARTTMQPGEIQQDCRGALVLGNPVVTDNDKTVRPWMTVVAYLLSDFKFLYE